jgi:hypothetical protein
MQVFDPPEDAVEGDLYEFDDKTWRAYKSKYSESLVWIETVPLGDNAGF